MKKGFAGYLAAAFNARPFGMFVAPNWIGVAGFSLLGLLNPGFWLIGLGLEVGYLATLATNKRFQRAIDRKASAATDKEWQARHDELLSRLTDVDQARYVALVARCRAILEHQAQGEEHAPFLEAQQESLARLTWMYLRLLLARRAMARLLRDGNAEEQEDAIEARAHKLRDRLNNPELSEELRRSLTSQLEIVEQRLAQREEGKEKLAFLDAELGRLQEQAELLREQAVLSTDPRHLSERIDSITATLGGTAKWITEQQRVYGALEDLMEEPPPLAMAPRQRESA